MKTKTPEHKDADSPHRLTSFFYQDDIFKTCFLLLLIIISVFFKVLSRRSFFKGKWLWVSKSNMADETSYCLYFPASTARFVKKTVPIRTFLSQKSFYVFRKDRQCKFKFLLSPNLDLINIISVRALKALDF